MHVKPHLLDEYVRRHAAVWPEMLAAIQESGRSNYSLFLRPDGQLIGYFEVESLHASERALAENAVTALWESEMSDFFVASDGRADQNLQRLTEIFNLEDQLRAIG